MRELCNLVVDLPVSPRACRGVAPAIRIISSTNADDRTLAWIDQEFGGTWSSEARHGPNVIAYRDDSPIGFATFDPKGLRFAWLRGIARERDVGIFGPFGVAASERGQGLGATLLRQALMNLRARGYGRALIAAVGNERLIRYYTETVGARVAERFDIERWATPRPRVLAMVSGNGTNLQALLDRVRSGALPIDVVGVISNNAQAYANERARNAGVPVFVMPWERQEESRNSFDERLLALASAQRPEPIVLLGWMHLLSESFVATFPTILNVHPAFLPLDPSRDDVVLPDGTRMPAFRGPHAVAEALAAGTDWVGATVHVVTAATDRGPVVARRPLAVGAGEVEADVMTRLHPVEHELVAAAVMRWLYERDLGTMPG